MKAKTVRDADSDEYSEVSLGLLFVNGTRSPSATQNLYVMSELAQHVIRARASSQSWNVSSFPGKVKLPIDIFKPHPSAEQTSQVG